MDYIDLSRWFCDLTEAELEAPELLASLNDDRWATAARMSAATAGMSLSWAEILQHPRVVVLAEAGSGKTAEMQAQATRLKAEGQSSFFIELERLQRPLAEILPSEENRALDAWKTEGHSTAWFFLDAVDELKLVQGKLKDALIQFARGIDGHLHRVHCVISCRPSDFRRSVDLAAVRSQLPFTPGQQIAQPSSDEAFLAPLREREGGGATKEKKLAIGDQPRTVVLLPLSRDQISTFVRSQGVTDTAALVEEVNRRDAWIFARRPGDLINLIAFWKAKGRLGTRGEQHDANVRAKLTDKPNRPDHGVLSDDQARTGAERLALALALTRTRTIWAEQEPGTEWAEGMLNPAAILSEWTPQQRQALLRRALFDPATYGRVRFHHRSVQEYLAAKRLWTLRQTSMGMSAKSLYRLLFAERYSMPLVIPSMQAIAAWLALWDDDVRREMMAREPETLLSMGDSESLPSGERERLLQAFAKLYSAGGWRGLDIHPDGVQQFADPALGRVVRELWDGRPSSPDFTKLLLEIIWRGSIGECSDIAHAVAFDANQPDIHRVIVIRALVACGRTASLHELRDSILREPEKWPDRVVDSVAKELFPDTFSVAQLTTLIQRAPKPKGTGGGFSRAMQQIVETIEPMATIAIELRDALTDLIWHGRYEEQSPPRFRGRFDHIAAALARLCDRQIEGTTSSRPPHALIWACVVANRFGKAEYEPTKGLKRHFGSTPTLREMAFWAEFKFISEIPTTISGNAWRQDYYHRLGSLIEPLTATDRAWLLNALHDPQHREGRSATLHALVFLCISEGRNTGQLDELMAAVRDDAELTNLLRARSTPPEPDPTNEKWKRKARRQELVREGRERQRLAEWAQWKEQLIANPEAAFSAEKLQVTTGNIHNWLESLRDSGYTHYNAWNENALQSAFGEDIATRAGKAFQGVWRTHPPTVKSQRLPEEREHILWDWRQGLTGLAAEAATLGWASCLTPDEARIAAAYATLEFNGFPGWLADVTAAHPTAIDDVIGREVATELVQADGSSHLQTLQCLGRTATCTKRLLAPHLRASLPAWRTTFQEEDHLRRSAQHLEEVLGILDEVAATQDRTEVAAECLRKLTEPLPALLRLAWLRGLFKFSPREGIQALEEALEASPEQNRSDFVVAVIAGLFGFRGLSLAFGDNVERADVLRRFVRLACRYVHPAEEQKHEGGPGVLESPERIREFLLMALLDTPGPETHEVVLDLAKDPLFAHYPDRLLLLERQRAAKEAEPEALRPEHVVTLERRFEAPPNDRDTLFTCMVGRLEDLAHDLAHHDFTDRGPLRAITEEPDMQRTLAWRLENAAKGAYRISREEEVADLKKPDIRLATVRGDQKAAIEVKIADKWTLTELENALRNQLVAQYQRHDTCRAGCLLLTYHGRRKIWLQPATRRRLRFAEVIEHLRSLAQSIERERAYGIKLSVCPLDLTDPLRSQGPDHALPKNGPERSRKRRKGRTTAKPGRSS